MDYTISILGIDEVNCHSVIRTYGICSVCQCSKGESWLWFSLCHHALQEGTIIPWWDLFFPSEIHQFMCYLSLMIRSNNSESINLWDKVSQRWTNLLILGNLWDKWARRACLVNEFSLADWTSTNQVKWLSHFVIVLLVWLCF